ncbi:MAG TPA: hypothetical protein ACHBX0_14130 [Arsenophonus sp.]
MIIGGGGMIPITVNQLATVTQGALHQINYQQADSLCLNEITTNSRRRRINGLFLR